MDLTCSCSTLLSGNIEIVLKTFRKKHRKHTIKCIGVTDKEKQELYRKFPPEFLDKKFTFRSLL